MYQNDFHRVVYGDNPIIAHPLKEMQNITVHKRVEPVKTILSQQESVELAQKVASRIRQRGVLSINGLGRSFQVMDKDRSGELSFEEVKRAFNDYRISHTDLEIQAVFDIFDTDHTGSISY